MGDPDARTKSRFRRNTPSDETDLRAQPLYEKTEIAKRRQRYGVDPAAPECALALSGGGIRSATFSLGLLAGLSQHRLLPRFDYLSTVSGGGYTGAFYCGLFAPRGEHSPVIDPGADKDLLSQPRAQRAIGYLRQSGRYLTPAGFGDYVYAVALLLRNWSALTLITGAVILLAELLIDLVRIGAVHISRHPGGFPGPISDAAALYVPEYLWLSPILGVTAFFMVGVVSFSWAYWLTMSDTARPWSHESRLRKEDSAPLARPPLWGTLLAIAGGAVLAFTGLAHALEIPHGRSVGSALLVLASIGLAGWLWAYVPMRIANWPKTPHEEAILEDRTRHRLTQYLSWSAQGVLWTLIAATADILSFAGFQYLRSEPTFSAPLVIVLLPLGRWLVRKVSDLGLLNGLTGKKEASVAQKGKSLLARLAPLFIWLMALLFIAAAFAFWGGLAHWLTFDLQGQGKDSQFVFRQWTYWLVLVTVIVFVALTGLTRAFSNLSSLATFYAARLRRAYLGAGNPSRIGLAANEAKGQPLSVNKSHHGDDLGLYEYYAGGGGAGGAPVHLINVTINATRGHGPATVQRDRHGLNMVISPEGMSYQLSPFDPQLTKPLGHEDDALGRDSPDQSRPGQSLPVSTWVGISGAAFTTGLGSQTSLAKSVLAFLANVRLGYWWNSNRDRIPWSGCYPSLMREMFASFHGTDHLQWYLSDGGHFENSAVYELVRRKVPFIVVSDNGCDPDYGFQDLANLARKCRIDFGASIEFMSAAQLTEIVDPALRPLFGTPSEFVSHATNLTAVAMLARITFADKTCGTMLVVKPRLTDDGPTDLLRYKFDNPEFPQQTTLDQFFDEAQWESYHELGRLIACGLFRQGRGVKWSPAALEPVGNWP